MYLLCIYLYMIMCHCSRIGFCFNYVHDGVGMRSLIRFFSEGEMNQ